MIGKTDKTAIVHGAYSGSVQSCRPHPLSRDGAKKEVGAQGWAETERITPQTATATPAYHAISPANTQLYFTALLPVGLSGLEIQTSGGTGNADLYAKLGNWPSTTDYDGKSTQADNTECVTMVNPAAGWYCIMLPPTQSFSGVQIPTLFHH
jgi:hypothetical protein